jgi:hypothetical protein
LTLKCADQRIIAAGQYSATALPASTKIRTSAPERRSDRGESIIGADPTIAPYFVTD